MPFGTGTFGTMGFGGSAAGAPAAQLSAWDRELGATQGRIMPVNFSPVDGEWVFCLGRDIPGLEQDLNVGDFVEVEQTADFGSTEIVTATMRLRGPSAIPAGRDWKFSIRIDGAERASRILRVGETVDQTISANVSQAAPGNHTLAFRLELL